MMHAWDASQYLRFANERTQSALDLVARLPLEKPRQIIDLGCGPGNSTVLLRQRWPDADVAGLDTSFDMIETARRDHPGIAFVQGDLTSWAPAEPFDLVFSNAALQWVGDHRTLVPRLVDAVAPGGALAVQMPRNHDFATHALMRQVAADGPWRDRMVGARDPSPVEAPEFYYDCLSAKGCRVTLWETNYIQVMDDVQAIITWLRGTGLRPFLARLAAGEEPVFLERYAALLAEAFPARADGKVLLPYPRLFFIASPG
ncbi:MAG TPA: trans-aconitate 2-methyltransferase [Stellaceae bacterium]|jgi:trans-aconitate 2-methyltransferase|nr:trans-aconitate 2-methyltransferase [Stellaceae bacterium]